MKSVLSVIVVCLLVTASSVFADTYRGSRLVVDECPAPTAAAAPPLAASIVTGLLSGALTFVTDELKNLKERYSGMDGARGVGCFGQDVNMRYERGVFDSEGDLVETDMILESSIKVHGSSFRIVPSKVMFNESTAKWGNKKDITVTYGFSIPEANPVSSDIARESIRQISLEPFVIKNVKEGTSINFLNELGLTSGLAALPEAESFFMVNITINETSTGKGAELAARIGESISEQLIKNKDAIITDLVGKVVK